jgi:hypothetical protein
VIRSFLRPCTSRRYMHQATLLLYDEISSTYVECNLIAGAESGTPKDSESGAEVSLVLVWDATAS